MAYVEFNALSTVLGGSFTARAFLPGLDRLDLEDARHQKDILFFGSCIRTERPRWNF